jgi:hypothetical protein
MQTAGEKRTGGSISLFAEGLQEAPDLSGTGKIPKNTEKKRVINVIFLRAFRLDSLKAACYSLND